MLCSRILRLTSILRTFRLAKIQPAAGLAAVSLAAGPWRVPATASSPASCLPPQLVVLSCRRHSRTRKARLANTLQFAIACLTGSLRLSSFSQIVLCLLTHMCTRATRRSTLYQAAVSSLSCPATISHAHHMSTRSNAAPILPRRWRALCY